MTLGLLTPALPERESLYALPDHILQFIISIPRYQHSKDTDNPNGNNDTAHVAPVSMATPHTTLARRPVCVRFLFSTSIAGHCRSPSSYLFFSHLPHAAHQLQGLAPKCSCNRYFSSHTSLNHLVMLVGPPFGKPLNTGAPEFRLNTCSFTLPPNMCTFPLPPPLPALPAFPSPRPATNMGMDSMHAQAAQQGCEMCQRCGMVGSVDPPEASEDSRNDDSLQGPSESPSCKSAPPSPTQQQGHLDAAAHPFTLPGLGGINFGMTKEPAFHMESPISEGTARTMELGRRT